jgi:N-hydroxyarylamine O-acetyltransferase
MTLLVEAEGQRYLADTGFGAQGLLEPIRFECGVISELPLVAFRLAEGNGLWILQSVLNGQWSDLYAFTLEPQERIDYVMGSHFTATFPDSIFRKTLTAQIVRRHERKLLRQGVLKIIRADGEQVQTVRTDRDTRAVLSGHFGIKLPSDCVLPARIFEPLSQ